MARQSIPRFDLYAELGVEPSADDGAIESAYHARVDEHLPNLDAAATRKRVARLNEARDWLSDSELRNRYDASRARAAARSTAGVPARRPTASSKARTTTRTTRARSAKAAAAETTAAETAAETWAGAAVVGATALTAAEAAEAESRAAAEAEASVVSRPLRPEPARSDFSWPAADLARPAADLERPTTKPIALQRAWPRRVLLGVAGLAGLMAAAALVLLALSLAPGPVAVASPTVPPPTPTAAPATQNPTPEPTVPVATEPPPTQVGPPLEQQQQTAWDLIQRLVAAAAAGDVATARSLLGDTAPGLRASGLKAATFPDTAAGDISTQREGELYVALAENDRLTSPDGLTWTFDYADRPLAAYRRAAGTPRYDLYWIESDGKHHLYLRAASATISKTGVTVEFTWDYTAGVADEATYFRRARLLIASVTFDDTPITVTATPMPMRGVTTLTATATFTGAQTMPDLLTIGVSVSNPRTAGGAPRAVEVAFKLPER